MTEGQLEAAAIPPDEAEPVDTGNYPLPEDGPQDDVPQTTSARYDEDLFDGAGLAADAGPDSP
jgi:hypothetical protein